MKNTILVLILICFITIGAAAEEDENLVLYLTFDDTGEPEDLSPKGSSIASFIEPAELAEGVAGNAWLFNDSTCILIEDETFNSAFLQSSFSVWIKEPGEDGIIYEEGGTTKGFAVSLVKGEVQFATRDNSVQTTTSADYPDDAQWHFITAIFDNGTILLYMDGKMMDEESGVPGINPHSNETAIGTINGGQCTCGHSFKFTGIMDELRITRRALTTAEVQEAYRDGAKNLAVELLGKRYTTWGSIRKDRRR